MLLSARLFNDCQSVNSWENAAVIEFSQGDPTTAFFQLIDQSLDRAIDGFNPSGRRYVPATGATLKCVVESIDSAKAITRLATQPFASDPSIWSLGFIASDLIQGTCNLRLTLTEGSVVRSGIVKCAFRIHGNSNINLAGSGYSLNSQT